MSSAETATFIGGPWDLHRVAMPEFVGTEYVPTIANLGVGGLGHGDVDLTANVKMARYLLNRAYVDGRRHAIYLFEGY